MGLSTDPDGQARLMDNDRYLQALRQRSAVMPYGMPVSSDPDASDAYGQGVVRGVAKNLRARAGDFINALRSPMETLGGIVETGKQIVRDPKGSVRAMAQAEALRAANVASGPEAAGEYAASFLDPLRLAGAVRRGLPPAIAMAAPTDKPMTMQQAYKISPKSLHSDRLNKMTPEELEDLADELYEELSSVSDDTRSFGPNYSAMEPAGFLNEYFQNNAGKFSGDWNSIVRDFLRQHVDTNPRRVGESLRSAGRSVAEYKFNEPNAVREALKAAAKRTD